MEAMGYHNADLVLANSERGRMLKSRGGKVKANMDAIAVLFYMALNTYDWPPNAKLENAQLPCRYYTLGWRAIAEKFGMVCLSEEQLATPDIDVEAAMKAREATAKNQISQTWRFLQEKGLIKCLQPASLGRNAGYLLTIGTASENAEVEAWARKCLGL